MSVTDATTESERSGQAIECAFVQAHVRVDEGEVDCVDDFAAS